jgi:hypothetical protein
MVKEAFVYGSSSASGYSTAFDPHWARSPGGRFFRLNYLDPEAEQLSGASGVFVIWHGGVRPSWVYVDGGDDLATSLHAIVGNEDVMSFEVNGGLFVTWALIRPECLEGVLAHLIRALRPRIPPPVPPPVDTMLIPVLIPGGR